MKLFRKSLLTLLILFTSLCAHATTETFNQTSGTLLSAISANWQGATTGIETNGSGSARAVNNFAQKVWYSNSQGDTQQSVVTFTMTTAIGYVRVGVQVHGTQAGYEAWLLNTNDVQLRKNGGFEDSATLTGADWSAGAQYTVGTYFNSGTGLVEIWGQSGEVSDPRATGTFIVSITDGSPLSGGFPGFEIRSVVDVNSTLIQQWSDGGSANLVPGIWHRIQCSKVGC